MDFADWPKSSAIPHTNDRADASWVTWRTLEPNAQTRLGTLVVIQLGRPRVLCDDKIDSPIRIVVTQGCGTLFTVDFETALLARHCSEAAFAIPAQPKASPRVVA